MKARPALAANLALAAGSVALAAAFALLLEGGLRLLGVGAPDPARPSRLAYQRLVLPALEPAELADGTAVWRSADPRLPVQWLRAQKPAGGLRVLTFGGSATAGLGFGPNASFSRALARSLEAAYPERTVEVANLGIVALSARQVRALLADSAQRYAPDVLVVYSGNNEFLELHAEKYARATGGPAAAVADRLRDTHLYRSLARRLRGPPRDPSLAGFGEEHLRLTQDAIVREVETSPEETRAVVAAYGEEIRGMAAAAERAGAALVLMTVASNWRWRGREDLPADWQVELLAGDPAVSAAPDARRARARELLDRRIETAPAVERHESLFRRAALFEELGRFDLARADYRAAMNADPRLRRALDAMNAEVRRVAGARGLGLVDSVAVLAADAPHGIVGFEAFYDYVHFTPRGAELLGAAIFAELRARGLLPPPAPGFELAAHREARLAWLAALREDPQDVREWLGFGFDRAGIADRDLWKYDRLLRALDRRIEDDPGDVRARAYRGNARSFRAGAAADAGADYRGALAAGAGTAVAANLARLGERGGW